MLAPEALAFACGCAENALVLVDEVGALEPRPAAGGPGVGDEPALGALVVEARARIAREAAAYRKAHAEKEATDVDEAPAPRDLHLRVALEERRVQACFAAHAGLARELAEQQR